MKIDLIKSKISDIYNKDNTQKPFKCVFELSPKSYNKTLKELKSGKDSQTRLFSISQYTIDPIDHSNHVNKNYAILTLTDTLKCVSQAELADALEELVSEQKQSRKTKSLESLKVNSIFNNQGKRVEDYGDLSLPIGSSKYNATDRKFFDWFRKDSSGNIYLVTKDNDYMLIPYLDGKYKSIAQDSEFWTTFWKTHHSEFARYEELLTDIAWECFDKEIETNVMIEKIHEVIPKKIMDCIKLCSIRETVEDDDGQHDIQKSFNLTLKNTLTGIIEKGATPSEVAWENILSYSLAKFDMSELKMIKNFSNSHEGLYNIDISQFQKPLYEMPKSWAEFFSTKFTYQKLEQQYRLAKFVVSILDEKNVSRQALVLAGRGNDGKTLFTQILAESLNNMSHKKDCASFAEANVFNPGEGSHGLDKCMMSRLICVPDCNKVSELIETDTFKKITGGDTISCDVKYKTAMIRNMLGTKIIMTTNNPVYIADEYSKSRIIPLYFSQRDKSIPDMDLLTLKSNLNNELVDFYRWCFTYSKAMDDKLGYNMATQIFMFKNHKAEFDKENIERDYKTTIMDLSINTDDRFRVDVRDDYEDEDTMWMELISSKVIKFTGDNKDYIKCCEIPDLLNKGLKLLSSDPDTIREHSKWYTFAPKNKDMKTFYKFAQTQGAKKIIMAISGKSYQVLSGVKIIPSVESIPDFSEGII